MIKSLNNQTSVLKHLSLHKPGHELQLRTCLAKEKTALKTLVAECDHQNKMHEKEAIILQATRFVNNHPFLEVLVINLYLQKNEMECPEIITALGRFVEAVSKNQYIMQLSVLPEYSEALKRSALNAALLKMQRLVQKNKQANAAKKKGVVYSLQNSPTQEPSKENPTSPSATQASVTTLKDTVSTKRHSTSSKGKQSKEPIAEEEVKLYCLSYAEIIPKLEQLTVIGNRLLIIKLDTGYEYNLSADDAVEKLKRTIRKRSSENQRDRLIPVYEQVKDYKDYVGSDVVLKRACFVCRYLIAKLQLKSLKAASNAHPYSNIMPRQDSPILSDCAVSSSSKVTMNSTRKIHLITERKLC